MGMGLQSRTALAIPGGDPWGNGQYSHVLQLGI